MYPVGYYSMIRSKSHKFDMRVHLVRFAMEKGIRAAQRTFSCSRNTVRKWLRRFEAEGPVGLKEKSRAPGSCPHKTCAQVEREVLRRRRQVRFGAARLKREFGIKASVGAISRILREHKLTRRRKRKHRRKRDLREVKARYKALTRFHMDTKYLNDIPNYWPQMVGLGLPEFQYTVRCLKTGATFLGYGSEISITYAELTARRVLQHLREHGVDTTEVVIQTDRGTEFEGQAIREKGYGFTHTIEEQFKACHRMILRPNPNANADVESFHSLEEPEFFDAETFKSRRDFFEKVTTYLRYFNLARLNSYKGWRSPLDILTEGSPHLNPEILLLAPMDLDILLPASLGHHVPVHPEARRFFVRACAPEAFQSANLEKWG